MAYWEETFEGTLGPIWDTCAAPGCPVNGLNPLISTDVAFAGTKSLKGIYTGKDSGYWIDRQHSSTSEVWTRYYYRTTSFTYDGVGTKLFHQGNVNAGTQPNFWWEFLFGSNQMGAVGQGVAEGGTVNYFPNGASVPFLNGQWYKVETRLKMNTPGVADGIMEAWVDGIKTMNYQNRMFRAAGNTTIFPTI